MKAPAQLMKVRRHGFAWPVALALVQFVAPSARAHDEIAPDDIEIRTVMDSAAPCLNVRERPSYRSRIAGCVDSGRSVQVTGANRGWSYIIVDEELRGWAGTRFLEGGQALPAPAEPAPGAGLPAAAERMAAEPIEEEEAPLPEPEPAPDPPSDQPAAGIDLDEFLRVSTERDRTLDLLAAARARVDELEAEVGALREQAQSGSEDSAALAAMTAERDDLARQLARAEAQQLYLQSALEETRSELMRLKGIPAKLVRIEPPPEPEPLQALEPEPPAVEEEASEPAAQLPEIVSVVSMDEVVGMVRAWAEAWSDQLADRYLSFYSVDFTPADGTSRELWAAQRRARIEAPRTIEVTLERISPIVAGDRATVSFEQRYKSDSFEDVVDKTLVLERIDGLWRIVEELVR